MTDKPKGLILFPEVPGLVFVPTTRHKNCDGMGCRETPTGHVMLSGDIFVYGPLCFDHAKIEALKELKAIAVRLEREESLREAYNKIADEKR